MKNISVEKVSTSRLVQAANRSNALRVLYKNADISAKEFDNGKAYIRLVLLSEMSSPDGFLVDDSTAGEPLSEFERRTR